VRHDFDAFQAWLTGNYLAGLQRTDNNMDLTSFPQVAMINQKNYYTSVLSF